MDLSTAEGRAEAANHLFDAAEDLSITGRAGRL